MTRTDTFAELMKQIVEALSKRANRIFKEYDLTFSQMLVLKILYNADGHTLSQREMIEKLVVSQPTVTGIIQRLKKKEFVRIVPDSSDGRMKMVQLTESGIACYRATEEKHEELERLFWSAFTTEEKDNLIFLLTKLRDSLVAAEHADA